MTRAFGRLPEYTESRIIKALEAGILSQAEIAREMRISPRAVQRCVTRYKVAHPGWSAPERRNRKLR